jgi:hypothetical protein
MAEHHANEAMLDQIRSADEWNFYQAKSIKANLFTTKIELLKALGKYVDGKDTGRSRKRSRRKPRGRSVRPRRICGTTRSCPGASRCFRSGLPWGQFLF